MKIRVERMWTPGMPQADGPYLIEVADGTIAGVAKVETGDAPAADVTTGFTAVPGYVDCHEHIGIDVGDEHAQSVDDASRIILRGVRALGQMLDGGVTTIRDCGERTDVEPYWIEAIGNATISGPRVIRSVTPICRTGGHAWYLGAQADGVDALRAAVRRNVRDGADFIKVMATGGLGTIGSSPDAAEFTLDELTALVSEAHRLGRKVAAHAHGGQGVDDALAAGVDSIEHGCRLTDEQLARMADQKTVLVVTMGVGLAFEVDPAVPAEVKAKASRFNDHYWKVIESARSHGVPVTVGSDAVHGGVAQEMSYLVRAGYSPVEALAAGTASGADLLGRDDLGRLTAGSAADLVFVEGDPSRDIAAAAQVRAVMTRGQWARQLPS